ncbi:Uncharacterized conserved protein YaaN involved in tellurite resistance [Vibrio xiamenensis]|uniref:Uncharacterized conserved protein YaaN involved in tellurite resistance n=1 Tax=Vibrio xiamenensis TaxID=861298 RepID=A0A1G8DDG1_9VIBR|nr:toxic anion resistance protein [Vibrio xiamenensis]SDH55624.1 Uncharacterized conserved protein YaaN involved in tellurite resistance [Vibrio xiamenensis]
MTTTTATESQNALSLPTVDAIKQEITTNNESRLEGEAKMAADQWLEKITTIDPKDLDAQLQVTTETKTLGNDIELRLTEQSKLLQAPMSELMADAENGGDIALDLLKLEDTARSIDPNGFDFTSVSGFRRFLARIGVPTALQQWIAKYQSTEAIIKSIATGLEQGKAKLKRDNTTLKEDQIRYRKTLFSLDDYINFAAYIDNNLETRIAQISDENQLRFLKDEVLFPMRQRHQDLLTSKAVYQQAWVTSEFIIKTNEELIRGVDRALKHTMTALGVATSLAIALARQKKVLVALQSSKEVTAKMIADIADRLESQGAAVMQQASEPYIQVEVMKSAFSKTLQAMAHVSNYRAEAIDAMKSGIDELKTMTSEMDDNIKRIEQGQQTKEQFRVILN